MIPHPIVVCGGYSRDIYLLLVNRLIKVAVNSDLIVVSWLRLMNMTTNGVINGIKLVREKHLFMTSRPVDVPHIDPPEANLLTFS